MQKFVSSLRHPLLITVLVAALAGGLSVTLWLLPIGLAVAGIMLRELLVAPPSLPTADIPRITNPLFKTRVDKIDALQREIERSIRAAHGPIARALAGIAAQTRQLVEQAHHLAARGEVIDTTLRANQPFALQDRIQQIGAQLQATADDYTRKQLEETQRALQGQLEQTRGLHTYIERINAQLARIDAALGEILVQTVSVRTSDAAAADALGGEVSDSLRNVRIDMDTFQQLLDTAMPRSR
jgi:chromosome segregation ATPase